MPAGPPTYKPTPADRNTVRTMAAGGFSQEIIARCLGTEGIDPKTMRRHFRQELDVSMAMANAEAVAQLQKAIQRGESWAITLRLRCRAGWKDASKIEHSGPDGAPIEVNDVSPRERLARRIAGLAARTSKKPDPQ